MHPLACFAILALVLAAKTERAYAFEPWGGPNDTTQVVNPSVRDRWQLPDSVITLLDLPRGAVVADLGAGWGYFTHRLARAVGPNGKVLALDINAGSLQKNAELTNKLGLTNVETRLVPKDGPALELGEADVVFVCNTWQFLPEKFCYAKHLASVLEPGARMAVISKNNEPGPIASRAGSIDRYEVQRQAEAAGMRLVAEHKLPKQFFLIFEVGKAVIFELIPKFRYVDSEIAVGTAPLRREALAAARQRGFLQVIDAQGSPNSGLARLVEAAGLRYVRVDFAAFVKQIADPNFGVSLIVGSTEAQLADLLRNLKAGGLALPTCERSDRGKPQRRK